MLSEPNLKTLSEGGKLARYKVLYFAIHGLLAAEESEPPASNFEEDGLITASEWLRSSFDTCVLISAMACSASIER